MYFYLGTGYIIQNKVRFHNVFLCISSTGFTVIYRSSGVNHFNMASLRYVSFYATTPY